jgi:hypothetical protein
MAFFALLLAGVVILAAVVASRRGKLSRGALIGIAAVIALLVGFGMTGGVVPRL